MKYSLLICCAMILGMMNGDSENDYNGLWKKVEKKQDTHPREAYQWVEQIYDLALEEGADDHLIKAVIYKYKLKSAFEDHESADYLLAMEEALSLIKSQSGKAIFSSLLGQLFFEYGTLNQHRFRGRTEGAVVGEAVFSSLGDIQSRSLSYYKQSLGYTQDRTAEDFDLVLLEMENGQPLVGRSLRQILVFNAINTFKDSRSLVALPTDAYAMNSESLFDYQAWRSELDAEVEDADYKRWVMLLFDEAKSIDDLTPMQSTQLEMIRLDFLKSHVVVAQKDSLYKAALLNLTERYTGAASHLPLIKLIGEHLQQAQWSRHGGNYPQRGYTKAAELLARLKDQKLTAELKKKKESYETLLNQKELSIELARVYVPEENLLGKVGYRNLGKATLKIYELNSQPVSYTHLTLPTICSV